MASNENELLPDVFDVIVVGTGMVESIVAGACARVGHSVLHIDRNEYYGGSYASFNLRSFQKWADEISDTIPTIPTTTTELSADEVFVECPTANSHLVSQVSMQYYVRAQDETPQVRQPFRHTVNQSQNQPIVVAPELNNIDESELTNGYGEDIVDDISGGVQGLNIGRSVQEENEQRRNEEVENVNSQSLDRQILDNQNLADSANQNSQVDNANVDIDNMNNERLLQGQNTDGTNVDNPNILTFELDSADVDSSNVGNVDSQNVDVDSTNVDSGTVEHSNVGIANTEGSSVDGPDVDQSGMLSAADHESGVLSADHESQEQSQSAEDRSPSVVESSTEQPVSWSVDSIEREWRRFNIDLSPRLLYCRGPLVDLLVSSDVGKYCEFKTVDQVLTVRHGLVEKVPCSRADVFSSNVSMIEKRMLMRFMQFCLDFDPDSPRVSEIQDEKFCDFLRRRNLSENIQHYIIHAIAMATNDTPTIEGLQITKDFMQSLGRYGNTAFLWPLYGSGELPQCFARLCAVFGGVYCLRTSVSSLVIDSALNQYKAVILTNGQRIQSRWLVMESSYLPVTYTSINDPPRFISRAIIMADGPIFGTDPNKIQLLRIPPPTSEGCPVTVLQLSASAMACPRHMCIVHLTKEWHSDPQTDLRDAVSLLFQNEGEEVDKPKMLWSCYFKMADTSLHGVIDSCPSNVFSVAGAGLEVNFDGCVAKAKSLFHEVYPDDEFLPKVPDPEDIVYDFGGGGASEAGMVNGVNGDMEGLEGVVMGEGGDGVGGRGVEE